MYKLLSILFLLSGLYAWKLPFPIQQMTIQDESDIDIKGLFNVISIYINYQSMLMQNNFEDPINYAKGQWPNGTFTSTQPASGFIFMPIILKKTGVVSNSIVTINNQDISTQWTTNGPIINIDNSVDQYAYDDYVNMVYDDNFLIDKEEQDITQWTSIGISFTSMQNDTGAYYYYKYLNMVSYGNISSPVIVWSDEIETIELFKLDEDFVYYVFSSQLTDNYEKLAYDNPTNYMYFLIQNELLLRLQDILWYSIIDRELYVADENANGHNHLFIKKYLDEIYDYYENNLREGEWVYHINISSELSMDEHINGRYKTFLLNKTFKVIPWFDNSYQNDFKSLYNNGKDVTLDSNSLYGSEQDVRSIADSVNIYARRSMGNSYDNNPPGRYVISGVHVPKMAASDFDSLEFGFGNAPLMFTGTNTYEIPQRYVNLPILASINLKASPNGFGVRRPSQLLGDVTVNATDDTYYDIHNTKWAPANSAYDPGQMWTIGLSSLLSVGLSDYAYSIKNTSTVMNNIGLIDYGQSRVGYWQSGEACSSLHSCYTAQLNLDNSYGHLYHTVSFPTADWSVYSQVGFFNDFATYISDSLLEDTMVLNNKFIQTYAQTAYLLRPFDGLVLMLETEIVLPGVTDIPIGNFHMNVSYDFKVNMKLSPQYFGDGGDYPTVYQLTNLNKDNWTISLQDTISVDCVMDIRNNKDYLEVFCKNTIPIDISDMITDTTNNNFPVFVEGLYFPQTYGFNQDDSSLNLSRWNYLENAIDGDFAYEGTFIRHAFGEIDVDYLKEGHVNHQYLPVAQPIYERAKIGIAALLDDDIMSYSCPLSLTITNENFKISLVGEDLGLKIKDHALPMKLPNNEISDAIQLEIDILTSDVRQVALEIKEVSSRLDDEVALVSEFIEKMKKMANLLQEDSFFNFFDTISRDIAKKRPELGRFLHSVSRLARAGVTKRPGAIISAIPAAFSLFSSAVSITGKHVKSSKRSKGMHYDDTSSHFIKEITGKPYPENPSPALERALKNDGTYTIREPLSALGTFGENLNKYANEQYPGIGKLLQEVNKNPTHQYSTNIISYETNGHVFTDMTVSGVSEMVPFTLNKQTSGKVYTQTFKTEWIEGNDRPTIVYNRDYYEDLINRMQWEGLTDNDCKRNIQSTFDKYWDSQVHAIEELSDRSTAFPSSTYELVTRIVGDAFKKYNIFSNNCQDYTRDIFNFFMNSEIPKNMSPTVFKWIINDVISDPVFVDLVNSLSSDI